MDVVGCSCHRVRRRRRRIFSARQPLFITVTGSMATCRGCMVHKPCRGYHSESRFYSVICTMGKQVYHVAPHWGGGTQSLAGELTTVVPFGDFPLLPFVQPHRGGQSRHNAPKWSKEEIFSEKRTRASENPRQNEVQKKALGAEARKASIFRRSMQPTNQPKLCRSKQHRRNVRAAKLEAMEITHFAACRVRVE